MLFNLSARLQEEGWIAGRVVLAPQNLAAGELRVTVLPGRTGNVTYGPVELVPGLLPLLKGADLRLQDIDQTADLLNRLPSLLSQLVVQPTRCPEGNVQTDCTSDVAVPVRVWAHVVGHQTEVRTANALAADGQIVVRWGDKVTTNGSDIVAFHPVTGERSLFDTKFSSSKGALQQSKSFNFSGPTGLQRYEAIREQALDAIATAGNLSPSQRTLAQFQIQAGNFRVNTVGAGIYHTKVVSKICGGLPC